jgi:hypothetical protein
MTKLPTIFVALGASLLTAACGGAYAVTSGPTTGSADVRSQAAATAALEVFLGHSVPTAVSWSSPSGTERRLEASLPGTGHFVVDLDEGRVVTAVLVAPKAPDPSLGSHEAARRAAEGFVALHQPSAAAYALRVDEFLDHGALKEWRFQWQAKSGLAWTPTYAAVTVDARGFIGTYSSNWVALTVDTTPRVTADQALVSAVPAGYTVLGPPELWVQQPAGQPQQLVWVVERRPATTTVSKEVVWVDAMSGASMTVTHS